MDRAYLIERIAKTKLVIEAYETAILALTAGGIEEYTIDTGQTTQRVKKIDINDMSKILDGLYNRLCVFQTRLNGGGSIVVRPAW